MSYCATNCGFFASPNSSYCTVCAKRMRPVEPVAQASFPSPAAAPSSAPPPPPPAAGGGGGMAVEAEPAASSSSSSSSSSSGSSSASVGGVGGASAAAAASSAASSSAAPSAGAGAAGAGAPAAAAAAMGGGAAAAAAAAPPPGPTLNPRRCPVMKDGKQCPVKRGLTSFSCNCGLSGLCGAHRYSDQHQCNYDWQADAQKLLALQNPKVQAAKLERM